MFRAIRNNLRCVVLIELFMDFVTVQSSLLYKYTFQTRLSNIFIFRDIWR